MTDNKFLFTLLFGFMCVNIGVTRCGGEEENTPQNTPESKVVEEHADTIIQHDTIRIYTPQPYKTDTIRYDTFAVYNTPQDSITGGTEAVLPFQRKTYQDSTCKAVISGYLPNLDTLEIYQRHIYITREITKEITKTKHWNIGIQAGYGVGLRTKDFQPYIGVGVTYTF